MGRISRDTGISIILLLFCGFLIWAGGQIRDPQFGELSPAAWPKGVTWVLTALCLLYFFQSVIAQRAGTHDVPEPVSDRKPGMTNWMRYYFNPIVCFILYFAFLYTLPFFGTLVGGSLLVFALLSVLGGIRPRQLILHAVLAIVSVGAMWSIFTFGLRVLLPRGDLFQTF